jgi:hypothetical protein
MWIRDRLTSTNVEKVGRRPHQLWSKKWVGLMLEQGYHMMVLPFYLSTFNRWHSWVWRMAGLLMIPIQGNSLSYFFLTGWTQRQPGHQAFFPYPAAHEARRAAQAVLTPSCIVAALGETGEGKRRVEIELSLHEGSLWWEGGCTGRGSITVYTFLWDHLWADENPSNMRQHRK